MAKTPIAIVPDGPTGLDVGTSTTPPIAPDAVSSLSTASDAMDTDVQQLPLPLSSMASAAISKSSTGSARFGTVVADNPIKLEDRIKIEDEELLGSVTTLSSPAVRTSARVIQKLKLDLIRPTSPPAVDRSDAGGSGASSSGIGRFERGATSGGHPKTPSHSKSTKVNWSSVERNLFFDAVCEYGKDFEAIANYVNQKVRRHAVNSGASLGRAAAASMSAAAAAAASNNSDGTSSATGAAHPSSSLAAAAAAATSASVAAIAAVAVLNTKSKEHVRLLYYQTFHKVTKYLRFSDDIKKVAQELYALINYGEMRKKLVFINHKAWAKLTELVYQGTVMVRVKGKNIRIKTPACKALRRLNQMEEWQEEIKLPAKVEVWLRPATGDAWNRVQAMAMNPRVRTTVPLQKRLVSLLRTMQQRWRSKEARLSDQTLSVLAERRHQAESSRAEGAAVTSTSTATTTTATTTTTTTTTPVAIAVPTAPPHQANQKNATLLLDADTARHYVQAEPRLRFAPPPNTVIHRPMVNLAEFLSSYSICLNAYEERIGVAVKGERLTAERLNSIALEGLLRSNAKRQRNDSGCAPIAAPTGTSSGSERRSPEYKRARSDPELMQAPAAVAVPQTAAVNGTPIAVEAVAAPMEGVTSTVESSADESDCKDDVLKTTFRLFGSELEQLCTNASRPTTPADAAKLAATDATAATTGTTPATTTTTTTTATTATTTAPTATTSAAADKAATAAENRAKRKDAKSLATRRRRENFRPLISESMVARIMRGWSETDIGDVTVGDLYIMFGQDFKLSLEYAWLTSQRRPAQTVTTPTAEEAAPVKEEIKPTPTPTVVLPAATTVDSADDAKIAAADADAALDDRIAAGTSLSNKLKHLLLLAGLAERAKEPKEPKASKKPAPAASAPLTSGSTGGLTGGAAVSNAAAAGAALPNCQCGHFCDKSGGSRANNGGSPRSYISNKIYPSSLTDSGLFRLPTPTGAAGSGGGGGAGGGGVSPHHVGSIGASGHGGSRFGPTPLDAYRMNLSQARYKHNRWLRTRNVRITSKQVVVQRLLPLQPGAAQTYDVIRAPDGSTGGGGGGGSVGVVNGFGKHNHHHNNHQHHLPLSPRAGPSSSAPAVSSPTAAAVDSVPTLANRSPHSHRNAQGLRQPRKIVLPDKPTVAAAQTKIDPSHGSPNVANGCGRMAADEPDIDDDDSIANDPGIQSLMDISLPSPTPSLSNMDDLFSYSNAPPMSPMTMLRQSPADPRWFDENVNDFSLSSFLGQLDAAATSAASATSTIATASATATSTAATAATEAAASALRLSAASGHDEDTTIETPRKLPLLTSNCNSNSCKLPPLETSRMSSISEASVDYMSKFEEIAQSMLQQQQQQND